MLRRVELCAEKKKTRCRNLNPINSPSFLKYLLVGLGSWIVCAPGLADVVFTSEPLTSAAVGRAYAYTMTAVITDDDDDSEDDGQITFIARALPPWLEFDGNDTIFGTPDQEDIGAHRVRLRAKLKGDRDDQDFQINVEPTPTDPPPEGADLSALIAVAPGSASVGDPVEWTMTAGNLADVDVGNLVLETSFSGDAEFSIDDVDDSSCSIELRGSLTAVVCRWSPLTTGASRTAHVSGSTTGAGGILAVARVSIVDTVPADRNPANDEASVVLIVSDASGGGDSRDVPPVLTLVGPATITITVGDTFEDPGATAMDNRDGDLTTEIVVDDPVDTNIIGRYSVTYDVVDSDGNSTTATRTVEVVPREAVGGGGGGAAGVILLLLIGSCGLGRRTRMLVRWVAA